MTTPISLTDLLQTLRSEGKSNSGDNGPDLSNKNYVSPFMPAPPAIPPSHPQQYPPYAMNGMPMAMMNGHPPYYPNAIPANPVGGITISPQIIAELKRIQEQNSAFMITDTLMEQGKLIKRLIEGQIDVENELLSKRNQILHAIEVQEREITGADIVGSSSLLKKAKDSLVHLKLSLSKFDEKMYTRIQQLRHQQQMALTEAKLPAFNGPSDNLDDLCNQNWVLAPFIFQQQ